MGNMVHSLSWEMQDLYHQPYGGSLHLSMTCITDVHSYIHPYVHRCVHTFMQTLCSFTCSSGIPSSQSVSQVAIRLFYLDKVVLLPACI